MIGRKRSGHASVEYREPHAVEPSHPLLCGGPHIAVARLDDVVDSVLRKSVVRRPDITDELIDRGMDVG